VSAVPIGKPFLFFIATRNISSMKTISGFRGIVPGLAVRLNNAPIRCNYFPLCLPVFLLGKLRSFEKETIGKKGKTGR